jgi:predicted ATPase/DNA-binding XRE family transcriptional regulator
MRNPSAFGSQLKQLRQEHGLTQDTLAERVGCATQTIRKIEGGQRRPSYQIAARLADELDIAPEERASFIRSSRAEPAGEPGLPPTELLAEPQPTNLPTPTSTLPAPLTRLIGREGELASAQQLLRHDDVRLLTLVGPGGAGKTRLSLEVAARLEEYFDDVVFVDLVPIHDPALVVPAIADALGIGEQGGRPRLERLKEGLRARRLLLVLDNFEQVIPAAALLADLLAFCPGLKAIVTSREVLRVRGERVLAVHPLAVPDGEWVAAGDLLARSAAAQLFAERAAAARPGFAVTDENAAAVAELCRRLDGLPLAIELAAARSTLFPPAALLARLGSRLKLLTGGPRDVPARQQTLRNTIDWSYNLLTEDEQKLLRRLSVFIGGGTLDAIADVCVAAGDIDLDLVDGLASLVDKSLLWQDAAAGHEPRFLMLETIREYGLEQLQHSQEAAATRHAHAGYYLGLVEYCEPHLWGASQEQWLERLEQEHGNLRVALAWYTAKDVGIEPALRMAGCLWRFWNMRGHWTEGLQWLQGALSRRAAAAPAHRWLALHGAGNLSLDLGEYARAKAYYEESLVITQQLKLERGIANTLLNLSLVSLYQGDLQAAITLQEEALAIHRAAGNKIGTALALHNLASMLEQVGEYQQAGRLAEESLARYKDLGDNLGIALALHDLALLAHRHGAYDRARALFEECKAIYTQLGARNDLARALNDLGQLLVDRGECLAAQALYDEGLRLAAELGDRRCQAALLDNLGWLAYRTGDQQRAVMLCTRGLSLQRDLGDQRGIAIALESLRQMMSQGAGADYRNSTSAAYILELGEHRARALVRI